MVKKRRTEKRGTKKGKRFARLWVERKYMATGAIRLRCPRGGAEVRRMGTEVESLITKERISWGEGASTNKGRHLRERGRFRILNGTQVQQEKREKRAYTHQRRSKGEKTQILDQLGVTEIRWNWKGQEGGKQGRRLTTQKTALHWIQFRKAAQQSFGRRGRGGKKSGPLLPPYSKPKEVREGMATITPEYKGVKRSFRTPSKQSLALKLGPKYKPLPKDLL